MMRVLARIVVRGEEGQENDPLVDSEDGLLVGVRYRSGQNTLKPGMIFEIVEVDRGLRLRVVGQSSIKNSGPVNWTQPINQVLVNGGPALVMTTEEVEDLAAAQREHEEAEKLAAFTKKQKDWLGRHDTALHEDKHIADYEEFRDAQLAGVAALMEPGLQKDSECAEVCQFAAQVGMAGLSACAVRCVWGEYKKTLAANPKNLDEN